MVSIISSYGFLCILINTIVMVTSTYHHSKSSIGVKLQKSDKLDKTSDSDQLPVNPWSQKTDFEDHDQKEKQKTKNPNKKIELFDVTAFKAYFNWPFWLPDYRLTRNISKEWKDEDDCFYNVRTFRRPYPNDCYGHSHEDPMLMENFRKFWNEVRGDLCFTFDYVLQDSFPLNTLLLRSSYVDQLWYLIAYLRQLAINFQSPQDIGFKTTSTMDDIPIFEIIQQAENYVQEHYSKAAALMHEIQNTVRAFDVVTKEQSCSGSKELDMCPSPCVPRTCSKSFSGIGCTPEEAEEALIRSHPDPKCPPPACVCKQGYYVKDIGTHNKDSCVRQDDCVLCHTDEVLECPSKCASRKCSGYSEWHKACDASPNDLSCPTLPVCHCAPGLYRLENDENSRCVVKEQCPGVCTEGQTMEACPCPQKTCTSVNYTCNRPIQNCKAGCRCAEGYVLDSQNFCKKIEDCFEVQKKIKNLKHLKAYAPDFIWVRSTISQIRKFNKNAFVGGTEPSGGPIWIIRALYNNNTTPGKLLLKLKYGCITSDGYEISIPEALEVLVEQTPEALGWHVYKKGGKWPETALKGGKMANRDPIYIGRVQKEGFYTPGKIVNKILYIAHQGLELSVKDVFEILVKQNKPPFLNTSDYEWLNTTVVEVDALKDRAFVGGKDYSGSAVWLIRALDEGNVTPGKLVADLKYASVTRDGFEIIVLDKLQVLTTTKPGTLGWVMYKKNKKWPDHSILGGKMVNGEPIYIGRTQKDGFYTPGKIVKKVLYIAYQGLEYTIKDKFEVLIKLNNPAPTLNSQEAADDIEWVNTTIKHVDKLNGRAFVGGKDYSGSAVWVIRALDEGSLTPGKLVADLKYGSVNREGFEIIVLDELQVLIEKKPGTLNWRIYKKNSVWPDNTVLGGFMVTGESIFIGRIKKDGFYTPGKILDRILYIAYQGLEYYFEDDFEVLTKNNKQLLPNLHLEEAAADFEWVNTTIKNVEELKKIAFVSGKDYSGSDVWVIRAFDEDNLTPGKLIADLKYGSVTRDGFEIIVLDNLQVLVEKKPGSIGWTLYKKNSNWPGNTVLGGQLVTGKSIYIGRIQKDGFYTPGKILDKTLYISYQGLEYSFEDEFEVLIKNYDKANINLDSEVNSAVYEWVNTTIKEVEELKERAFVGGKDYSGSAVWVIRAIDEDNLTPGKLVADLKYGSVTRDGFEIIVLDKLQVLVETKPGVFSWKLYKTTSKWPKNALPGGNMATGEPMYIGRTQRDGFYTPGKVFNNTLYIAYQGLEYAYEYDFEILTITTNTSEHDPSVNIQWISSHVPKMNLDKLKETAFVAGKDITGSPIWVIRANDDENNLTPGKLVVDLKYPCITWDGFEIIVLDNLEVLTEKVHGSLGWKALKQDEEIPDNALEGGKTANGDIMHIGRVQKDGFYIPGKILNNTLYIAYQGLEYPIHEEFEVLITRSKPCVPKASGVKENYIWKNTSLNTINTFCGNAFDVGDDVDETPGPLWIVRAVDESGPVPGRLNPEQQLACITRDGFVIPLYDSFDVLVELTPGALIWRSFNKTNTWIKNALVGGKTESGEPIYIGRALKDGHYIPGKILNQVLYIAYDTKELAIEDEFEVLVTNTNTENECD